MKRIFAIVVAMSYCMIGGRLAADGLGSDMWTEDFRQRGLFTPHANDCSASEAFVGIAGTNRGYCIEEDERSAATWDVARETCAAAGKRLPEPGEWKYACNNAAGLNNMTASDEWEWASNFAYPRLDSGGFGMVAATIAGGGGGCHSGSFNYVQKNPASQSSWPYRCVH